MQTLEKIGSFISLSFNSAQLHLLLLIVLLFIHKLFIRPILQFTINIQARAFLNYLFSSLIIVSSYLILYQFFPQLLKWTDFKITLQSLAVYGLFCLIMHLISSKRYREDGQVIKRTL